MKNRKRILSFILSAVMIMESGFTSFAAEESEDSIETEICAEAEEEEETDFEPGEYGEAEEAVEASEEEAGEEFATTDISDDVDAEEDNSSADAGTTDSGENCVTVDISDLIIQAGGFPEERTDAGSGDAEGPDRAFTAGDVEGAMNAIYEGLKAREKTIEIEAFEIPVCSEKNNEVKYAMEIFSSVMNAHPELFYVASSCSFNWTGDCIATVKPFYKKDYSVSDSAVFDARVKEIMSAVGDDWSNLEKALYLHDWLILHCDYQVVQSGEPLTKYDAYNALVEGVALCQGYSMAYEYLMQQAGIEGQVVTSSSLHHAWNLVKIEGEWFYMDCTWDDPENIGETYCGHQNFLRCRDAMHSSSCDNGTNHSSTDWIGGETGENVYQTVEADTVRYQWWKYITSPLPMISRKTLYIEGSKGYIIDFVKMERAEYKVESEQWFVLHRGFFWGGMEMAYVIALGNCFYYTTPNSIYRMNLDGESTLMYTISRNEYKEVGNIYGIYAEGNRINYLLRPDYDGAVSGRGSFEVEEVILTAKSPTAFPVSGNKVFSGDKIELRCLTKNSKIYYTTDGSDPAASSAVYSEPIIVPDLEVGDSFVIKAYSEAYGYADSPVMTFDYTVSEELNGRAARIEVIPYALDFESTGSVYVTLENNVYDANGNKVERPKMDYITT